MLMPKNSKAQKVPNKKKAKGKGGKGKSTKKKIPKHTGGKPMTRDTTCLNQQETWPCQYAGSTGCIAGCPQHGRLSTDLCLSVEREWL